MLVSVEGGKPENPEKDPRSKASTSNKLNPHVASGRNPEPFTTAPSLLLLEPYARMSQIQINEN